MIIGVIADLVAFRHNSPNESRIFLRVHSDEEKRGLHVCCFQNVENLRRPFRIGSVIESERDLMFAAGALMIERRELRKLRDTSRSDSRLHPPPGCAAVRRGLIDGNDFALAHVGDRVGALQNFEER